MGLCPGPAHAAQQYKQSLNFQTSNQSLWAAGPQYVASWSQEYSASWNNSSAGGSFTDLKTLDTRVTRVSMQRGEPLIETKLAPVGATGGQ